MPTASGLRVLLVDDDAVTAAVVRAMLGGDDRFALDVRTSLADAEAALGAETPDVVLLDLGLPDGGGLATFDSVHAAAAGVPIVVLTGIDSETLGLEAVERGAQDFLVKDQVDADQLRRTLLYAVERQRTLRRLQAQPPAGAGGAAGPGGRDADLLDFVSVVAHELRSPLTTIRGLAQTLASQWAGLTEETRARCLDSIVRQTDRIDRLSADLLTMAKVEGGGLRVEPAPVAIDPLLRTLLRDLELAGEVTVEGASDAVVRADADHVRSIVTNFFTNAVRYGAPPISARVDVGADAVTISVRDGGEGVPLSFVPRLFERFAHLPPRDQSTNHGVGLGLWIVANLARANGGEAWYEPAPAGGGTFSVRLPKA